MNPGLDSRLQLAYQAYHRTRPSEFEVNTGAHRILARMRSEPRRRRRRAQPFVILGVLLAGALAYAATGAVRQSQSTAIETRLEQVPPARTGGHEVAAPGRTPSPPNGPASTETVDDNVEASDQPGTTTRETQPETDGPEPPRSHGAADHRQGSHTGREQEREATWSDVGTALDAGDEKGAERALLGMLKQGGERHAKARLGLSQLALGRGDCRSAMRHARRVLDDEHAVRLHSRARKIVGECGQAGEPGHRVTD